jgi:hypothetical protein
MDNDVSAIFDINIIGDESGNPYTGSFKVRTLLTRRQRAAADEIRRDFIGTNPEGASKQVAIDGFVVGQLAVRVLDAPDFFKNAGVGGQNLPDFNVLEAILEKAILAEEERKSKLIKQADDATEILKKKSK